MDRRDSLKMLTGAIWAAGLSRAQASRAAGAGGSMPAADIDARLKRDVERIAPRVYSDEGIPVLLACVDLRRPAGAPFVPTRSNVELAGLVRDNAAAWERLYPEAKPEDVSKLIEVLADRDFAALGAGARR